MFESDLFDFFSRTHPAVVPILFVPATTALVWYSVARAGVGLGMTAGLFVSGVAYWSLLEYWLHRTFFHWVPQAGWGERMHFLVHGVHHKWPRDKYRLVMPPAVSISLFFIFGAVNFAIGGPRYGWALHAGLTFGYMFYDLMHFYVHHYNPKSKYLLNLKKHHMLHHFKHPDKRYGVSSKFWDYVFRTQA
jgi:4-hydroxysphinganine ceramide fatty acyl 2-hydroxylase